MDRQEDLSTAPGGSRSHPEGNTEPMSSPRRDRGNDATRFSYAWIEDAWTAMGSNYIYVLLVFVPLGIVAPNLGLRGQTVFLVEVLAIIPLGAVISFATRSLTAGHRQSSRGLMHAASRNLVDVIVLIVALVQGETGIVNAGILGAILANMLLMLGSCFVASGIRREESHFNMTVASLTSTFLAIAATYVLIPTALGATLRWDTGKISILLFSRGLAMLMLQMYALYLTFRLRTHAYLFDTVSHTEAGGADDGEDQHPHFGRRSAWVVMAVVAMEVAVCAQGLVWSINAVTEETNLSRTFIGLILLPLLSASEHIATCAVAYDSMDLAVDVAIGGCLQIVLFVAPLLVLLGWILDIEMSLHFRAYDALAFFFSVLIVNYLIQDGKSNYLEGCVLLATWLILAVVFYADPWDRPT